MVMVKDMIGSLAQIVVVLIVYTTRDWKYMHVWMGIACLIPIPCYIFVPESPRWLIINGKLGRAKQVLIDMAIKNGRVLSEEQRIRLGEELVLLERDAINNNDQKETSLNPLDMMRTKKSFMKTIVLLFNWVTVNVGTYTLMLNATKLHGDIFLNYTLMALVNYIPGTVVLLITLKCFSRRANLFYGQFILGTYVENKIPLCLKISYIIFMAIESYLYYFNFRCLLYYPCISTKIV